MGIMKLTSGYASESIEAASKEAIENGICNYKYFSMILKKTTVEQSSDKKADKIVKNTNIRGAGTYAGGVLNA